jgi:hypothetical protein
MQMEKQKNPILMCDGCFKLLPKHLEHEPWKCMKVDLPYHVTSKLQVVKEYHTHDNLELE